MEIMRRRELLLAGYADHELRRRLRTGQPVGVRRGTYVAELPRERDVSHLLQVRAAMPGLARDAVLSHVSAALVHGLPVWNVALDRVQVTRSRRAGARITPTLHVHAAPLDAAEIVEVGGLRVTSVARTVVDLARTVPFEEAVVVADGALHAELVTPADLDALLGSAARRPGNPAARRVVRFSDGRSESPGESRSRVAIARAGLPVPVLQWEVRSRSGRLLGRVDFGWPELASVGEFDGLAKYGRLLRPGQQAADVVVTEKLREDDIRDESIRMTRWTWVDLRDFTPVADRLRRAHRAAS